MEREECRLVHRPNLLRRLAFYEACSNARPRNQTLLDLDLRELASKSPRPGREGIGLLPKLELSSVDVTFGQWPQVALCVGPVCGRGEAEMVVFRRLAPFHRVRRRRSSCGLA